MSGRRFGGFGGGAFGLGIDYNELKEVHLDMDKKKTMVLPVNGPLNEIEKTQTAQFIHFQEIVRDGPFYTGSLLDNGKRKVEGVGINDGIKRYSDKYAKKRKILRFISDHPFKMDFFPAELHDVMNQNSNAKGGLRLTGFQAKTDKFYLDSLSNGNEDENEDEISKAMLEKLKNIAEVEDDKDKKEDAEADFEEEEEDEFDDDDDDDYNAEKYFEDGDDDFGGDMGGDDDEAAF